jgi:periplasmic copper chaperone A
MKRLDVISAATALAAAVAFATAAHGHVTFETKEAAGAPDYKAVLRVGHGCVGSPTVAIRVRIPEGVIAVKPMPKPGWQLTTTFGAYAAPYVNRGETVTQGVKEIAWTGGRLLDAHYDEFVFRAVLPDAPDGTVLHFPVVQQCEQGVHRWIEIPEPGKSARDYEEPAPSLRLIGKKR